jgi:hypothetical protein
MNLVKMVVINNAAVCLGVEDQEGIPVFKEFLVNWTHRYSRANWSG